MKVSFFFKAFSFFLGNTLVMAQEQGNCQEIKGYFSGNEELYNNTIEKCFEENGEVVELYISKNSEISEEILTKILSIDSIRTLYLGDIMLGYPAQKTQLDFNFKLPENIKDLTIVYRKLTSENIEYISSFTNLENLTLKGCNFNLEDIESIKNLSNLTSLTLNNNDILLEQIPEFVYSLSNLKYLNLQGNTLSNIPDKLAALKNLEEINFSSNSITDISEEFFNLSKLEYLVLGLNKLKTISDNIEKLTELKTLKLSGNYFTEFPKTIDKLKKLEIIDLSFNDIDDEIPESYNDLPVLKEIELWNNKNIKGKTLSNESLTKCLYHYNIEYDYLYKNCKNEKGWNYCNNNYIHKNEKYDSLCRGNEKCLQEGDLTDLKSCSESTTINTIATTITTTITITASPTSTDGKCGKEYGNCSSDYCCSIYGWCGKSDDYCSVSRGCQSKFGKCNKDDTTSTTINITTSSSSNPTYPISKDGKCGKDYGKCPTGQCCSKYGWCGKTYNYCATSEGCQSEYGICTKDSSVEGRCGKEYGKCPSGQCCSKYGWCGKSDVYCSTSKGCQSEFGNCN